MKNSIIKLFYTLFIVVLVSGCGNSAADDNDATDDNYIITGSVSVLNSCGFRAEYEKEILTFYYDETERIKKIVETTYWNTDAEASEDYIESKDSGDYADVRIQDNVVTTEYSKDFVETTYYGMTRESVIELYERCRSNPVVEGFEPNID